MTSLGEFNVSRETIDRLRRFEALVQKWSPAINLVSKTSLSEIWERHILDSAQLFKFAPDDGHWVDIGSGAGFPGIVVAALSLEFKSDHRFTLIESDRRKCAFLRTAIRELDLKADIMSERVEAIEPLGADILSARALADLNTLLEFAHFHLAPAGIALFPKGERWEKEHDNAQKIWSYRCQAITSKTNAAAAVLKIQDIARV